MIKFLQILAVNLPLVLDTSGVLLSRDHCSDLNLGSAWSFSLSGSSAKGTARRNQVNEQSGLYAEDGGYHINADNIHLKGGVIASTSAENSELSTNRFTFEDIQNDSHSQATSLSGSVGMSRSSDTLYDKNGKVISNPTRAQYADKTLKREKGETGLTGGIGIPLHESQSDSSLTKATLTEGKITLNKDSQPTQTTAKALGINTEIKNANEQVENTLNLDRTLQEQTAVQTAVANLQEAAKTYVDNKRQEAQAEFDKVKQQHNKDSETYKTAEAAVKAWEIGGKNKQNIDTVTAVVSTVLAGSPAEQIAVAALSPTLNNQIHALTKDDNSKVTNILAHAVLGAIEAKAAGVNGASGAVAAAGAEIIAHTLAEQLYGVDGKTKTIDDLTQEEKQNILTLSQIGSAIAGGMTADSGYAAGVSGEIGKRAVENNTLALVARGCYMLPSCRKAIAKEVVELALKTGVSSIVAAHIVENLSSDELEHLITLMLMGNDVVTEKFITQLSQKYASSIAIDPDDIPKLEGAPIKPNEPLILPYPVEENKDSTIVDVKPDVVDTSVISGSEINVGNWEDNVVTRESVDYSDKPKKKVNNSEIGDIVRTPDSHPEDFISKGKNKINKNTGEIWQKSDSEHTDKFGEWKVGLNGHSPTPTRKITIGRSDGKIIKIDK
ncbi:VENN motif pre-toxin domain-containing protein [uncultured Actinobacillus sp.]|uniref:VENN motif pre-toxin domain-containing protein n=1 Tax=uncultured Actinobacillus sp. TaxID=417616 RepID=UPI0025DEE3D9|nr:VENN motif pre-toxin domain-containing protein [uncultured Actinobacillus sp.]